jgi:hypothetical protein
MRFLAGALALLLLICGLLPAQSFSQKTRPLPPGKLRPAVPETAPAPARPATNLGPPVAPPTHSDPIEKLTYSAEWRMIPAGTVQSESGKHVTVMKIESTGLVSSLYRIRDVYTVVYDEPFCAASSTLDSLEGKRHHETKVTFDRAAGRATFLERDLLKNSIIRTTGVDTPNCVVEVLGAMRRLRALAPPVGQSVQIHMSDGRKSNPVKVEAQEREKVKTPLGSFNADPLRSVSLNGVVYPRKGRLFIWLSDDEKHLPVQIKLKLPFPRRHR